MRSLPLTNKTRPGGRPRQSRAPRNDFREWLRTCGMTPNKIAKDLGVSVSSIYNAANGYFTPGRALAVEIEALSGGAVSIESWGEAKVRKRRKAS